MKEVKGDILKKIYTKRKPDSRKYDFGLLTVIGGSEYYSGPPTFSSLAAFATGVDMVRIIAPKRAADIIASFSPNLATYPLEGNWLNKKHLTLLLGLTEGGRIGSRNSSVVVIGGGLGRSEDVKKVVIEYLSQINIPAVIDADAIYAVAERPEVIYGKDFIITPHVGEFFVLTGKDISGLKLKEKVKIVEEEAERFKTTILLKGAVDIISNGKETAINDISVPQMTVGGTGDVLAGMVGSLMARKISGFEAACAGVYLNNMAGIIASNEKGESMTAMDVIDKINEVLPKFKY
jgi:ADP-dependent NAD(P)H-hydrate dehydratase / NAD(P)H-hydrate epimerase